MAFDFNKLKSDIVSMGKDVGDKVSDASAVAKVKLDIHNKESYMEKQFTELGRAYYLAHKNEENIPEKEFFRPIAEAEVEIARLQEQLMTLKSAQVVARSSRPVIHSVRAAVRRCMRPQVQKRLQQVKRLQMRRLQQAASNYSVL